MSIYGSAGSYVREEDRTLFAVPQATASLGATIVSSRGPIDGPRLVTNKSQLISMYGPLTTHESMREVGRYLDVGNKLWANRVINTAGGTEADPAYILSNAANAIKLELQDDWKYGHSSKFTIDVAAGSGAGTYKVTVKYNGVAVEVFDNIEVGPDADPAQTADVLIALATNIYVVATVVDPSAESLDVTGGSPLIFDNGADGTATTKVGAVVILHQEAGDATLTFDVTDEVGYGSWANNLSIKVETGSVSGTYKISVLYGTTPVEVFDLLVLGSTKTTDQNYPTTRINGISEYVTVAVNDAEKTTLLTGTTAFTGGANGTVTNGDIIGSAGTPPATAATGLQSFANAEAIQIDMLAAPGFRTSDVSLAIQAIVDARQDCLGIAEHPENLSVQNAVAWHNGVYQGNQGANLTSGYMVIAYGYLYIPDESGTPVKVGNAGHVASAIAKTDFLRAPWFSPAGFERGLFPDVIKMDHSPTLGERDYMYSNGNVLNPIVTFQGEGTTLWGGKTCLRAAKASADINVRRLLLFMKKTMQQSTKYLAHQPNDRQTWRDYVNLVQPICDDIKTRRGLYDFRVICDETTNTTAAMQRKEMHGVLVLQPTLTAEKIVTTFQLVSGTITFQEL